MAAQTYNDDRLNEVSREVYYLAMVKLKAGLVDGAAMAAEKMHALAATADAAACGFKDDEENDYSG